MTNFREIMGRALRVKWLVCLVVGMMGWSFSVAQTKLQQKLPEKTRILFLFDGSGSMLEPWGRNQTKMSIARNILTKVVDSLKQNDKLELALRVYGHQFMKEVNNCKDTKLEVPFKARNHAQIMAKIDEIKPKGVTPITYSLEQAAKDFPGNSVGYRNIVILITDGIESCGGDVCATSRALQKSGIFLKPYIIGLGLRAEKTLDCAGKYISAETPQEFYRELNKAIESTFAHTTVSVELLDAKRQPTETNVNVSFVNTLTGLGLYDFVHYRDAQGRPDSVQVDPVVDYDLVVYTLPPTIKRNVTLENGKHNIIRIDVPQGNLVIQQEGRTDSNLEAIVRQKGKTEVLNVQRSTESIRYLAGAYEVETLTLPRRKFSIDIQGGKIQNVYLPAPGILNLNTIATGFGSLYEILADGTQEWVCDLDNRRPRFPLTLLPGKYKIVFRVKNAAGSKFTGSRTLTLKAGETATVNVFN